MNEITLSKDFQEQWGKWMGVRPRWVLEAVTHADKTEIVSSRADIRVHVRFSSSSQPPSVLVVGERDDGSGRSILFVLKAYEHSLPADFRDRSPVRLLKHLVDMFGVEVSVAESSSRFFVDTQIPVASNVDTNLIRASQVPGAVLQACAVFRYVKEEQALHLPLVFCLNLSSYRSWLESERTRVH